MEKLVLLLDKIPTGINTLGWLSILIVLLHLGWKNRRETHNETSHLRAEMEAFTERMGEANKELMDEVSELRKENRELREEVRSLQGIIDGLRRQNNSEHISTQRALIRGIPMADAAPDLKSLLHDIVDDTAVTKGAE